MRHFEYDERDFEINARLCRPTGLEPAAPRRNTADTGH
jgi:hypothetical protein